MYNNQSSYGRPQFFPPVIKWLLIINVAVFALGSISMGTYLSGEPKLLQHILYEYGALWPFSSEFFRPWQYLTTMFLHGTFQHLFFNMFVLWMFGFEIENLWGSKRFLVFYILSGLGASALHAIVTALEGGTLPAVGASGAIAGVVLVFAMLFPNRMILLFFFFPMKVKWAAALYFAYDLYQAIANNPGDNIAHFAHLGGALMGFILLKTGLHSTIVNKLTGESSNKQAYHVQPPPKSGRFSRADRKQSAKIIDAKFQDMPARPPHNAPVSMDFGENQEQVDRILDKISAQGYQSLTQEEKDLLQQASKRNGD